MPVYYTRNAELAAKFEEEGWDPNGRSPFTNDEYRTLPRKEQAKAWKAINSVPANEVQRITNRLNYFRRHAGSVGQGDFLDGDKRDYTTASGIRSKENLVTPLFSRAIVPDDDDQSYVKRSNKLIDEAKKFIFMRNFEFENLRRAKQLVEKAKEGVQVVLVAQPADQAIRPKEQREFLDFLRNQATEVPNLVVLESDIVPETAKNSFPQIMHAKSTIADTPDGLVAEIDTGINEGSNSPNNFDTGDYTEGVAALDSLNLYLSYMPREAAAVVDTSMVPHVDAVRKAVKKKAKKTGQELTPVEIGASGKRYTEAPVEWTPSKLKAASLNRSRIDIAMRQMVSEPSSGLPKHLTSNQVRALAKGDNPIQIWASDVFTDTKFEDVDQGMVAAIEAALKKGLDVELVFPPGISTRRLDTLRDNLAEHLPNSKKLSFTGVEPNEEFMAHLQQALENGSFVRLVTPDDVSKEILNGFRKVFEDLKLAGADIRRADDVVRDESYRQIVYRELDKAIERKESIDVSAFALSDRNFILKLIDAKAAGCPVRVVVDDLEIEESLINRKAWFALSRAGIEVRVLTDEVAKEVADWTENPEMVKAHTKFTAIGRERGDGKPPEFRVLKGSANFSKAGFVRNVEGGRLVESAEVARQFTERVMDRLWDICQPVKGTSYIPDENRIDMIQPAKVDSAASDHAFVMFDIESTGLAAHLGDYPLTFSAATYTLDENLNLKKVEGSELNLTFDLPPDELGRFLEIPRGSYKIHGIDRKQGPDGQTITTQLTRDDRDRVSTEVLKTVPLQEGIKQIRDYMRKMEKEYGSVVLGGQNINGFDLGVMDSLLGDARFDVDGEHYKIDVPYVDTLALSKRLFPDSRRHNLDALTKRLGLVEEGRKEHTAEEDTRLTAEAFGCLARMEVMAFAMFESEADADWIGRLVGVLGGLSKFEQADEKQLEQGIVQWFAMEPKHLRGLEGVDNKVIKDLRAMHPEDRAKAVAEIPGVQGLIQEQIPAVVEARKATEKADLSLSELMPIDKMWFEPGDKVRVYADPGNMKKGAMLQVEFDGDLRSREREGKSWSSRSLPVTEHKIMGISPNGKAYQVAFTMGSGKSANVVEGWVPAKDVKIWEAGPNTYRIRDQGIHKVPVMQRKVRPYVGLGTARMDK